MKAARNSKQAASGSVPEGPRTAYLEKHSVSWFPIQQLFFVAFFSLDIRYEHVTQCQVKGPLLNFAALPFISLICQDIVQWPGTSPNTPRELQEFPALPPSQIQSPPSSPKAHSAATHSPSNLDHCPRYQHHSKQSHPNSDFRSMQENLTIVFKKEKQNKTKKIQKTRRGWQ